ERHRPARGRGQGQPLPVLRGQARPLRVHRRHRQPAGARLHGGADSRARPESAVLRISHRAARRLGGLLRRAPARTVAARGGDPRGRHRGPGQRAQRHPPPLPRGATAAGARRASPWRSARRRRHRRAAVAAAVDLSAPGAGAVHARAGPRARARRAVTGAAGAGGAQDRRRAGRRVRCGTEPLQHIRPESNRGGHMTRTGLRSLVAGGLNWDSLPLKLFVGGNAKFWDPADIDFSRDRADWEQLSQVERDYATRLCAEFIAGEEAVTEDIQPFMSAMRAEGRLGDEMYLTQFAFEEAKHVQVFRMWLDAVGMTEDLHPYLDGLPTYREIFYDELPACLNALTTDASAAAQVR